MLDKKEYYFKNRSQWRLWLEKNHQQKEAIFLIFYKLDSGHETMRWEEAVQEALCFGWIDSMVKKIDNHRRRQQFSPRKNKSVWSKLNKKHIKELTQKGLMHPIGLQAIAIAKKNGSWSSLDNVENLIVPLDLQKEFDVHPKAFANYQSFAKTYKKNYLYWLNQAKKEETRQKRIKEIVVRCAANKKTRDGGWGRVSAKKRLLD
ncbi:MAG: YdeI/OmpD-associated family protein [Gammaproteobacteria bacterium]|nr:YdeI/OmpD-associated family protein [Gammaproteobacteria bacterium]